jgi:hypothetical protein
LTTILEGLLDAVVGATVTPCYAVSLTGHYVSSSDLAHLEISLKVCHCFAVPSFRPGADPSEGTCFPHLAVMYLAEAKPPVVGVPRFRDGTMLKNDEILKKG